MKATSTDPAQAEREQKSFHGVLWGMSLEQAREQAATEKKPILIDFTGVNCANCRQMERGVFPRRDVVPLLRKFVTVQLYTDYVPIDSITAEQRKERAEHQPVSSSSTCGENDESLLRRPLPQRRGDRPHRRLSTSRRSSSSS